MSKPAIAEPIPARRVHRVRAFAALGGVTVKALRYYDRLGLLSPARTAAGHRLYVTADLERLRRIRALKRVGIPLTRMRGLLDAGPAALGAQLAASRRALAHEHQRLCRTDRALALVEESLQHDPRDGAALSRLADVIDMPEDLLPMRRYFSDDVWPLARRFYEDWPREPWLGLYRDIEAAIPDGPATPRAEALLGRWDDLAQRLWADLTLDRAAARLLHAGFAAAWRDRANWPQTLTRRFADYRVNDIAAFLGRVSIVVFTRSGATGSAAAGPAAAHDDVSCAG